MPILGRLCMKLGEIVYCEVIIFGPYAGVKIVKAIYLLFNVFRRWVWRKRRESYAFNIWLGVKIAMIGEDNFFFSTARRAFMTAELLPVKGHDRAGALFHPLAVGMMKWGSCS